MLYKYTLRYYTKYPLESKLHNKWFHVDTQNLKVIREVVLLYMQYTAHAMNVQTKQYFAYQKLMKKR